MPRTTPISNPPMKDGQFLAHGRVDLPVPELVLYPHFEVRKPPSVVERQEGPAGRHGHDGHPGHAPDQLRVYNNQRAVRRELRQVDRGSRLTMRRGTRAPRALVQRDNRPAPIGMDAAKPVEDVLGQCQRDQLRRATKLRRTAALPTWHGSILVNLNGKVGSNQQDRDRRPACPVWTSSRRVAEGTRGHQPGAAGVPTESVAGAPGTVERSSKRSSTRRSRRSRPTRTVSSPSPETSRACPAGPL
jgi:hypothetical protein